MAGTTTADRRHLRPYTVSSVQAEIRRHGLPASKQGLYQVIDIVGLDTRKELGSVDRRWSHEEAELLVRAVRLKHIVGLSWAAVQRSLAEHGRQAWAEAADELVDLIRQAPTTDDGER